MPAKNDNSRPRSKWTAASPKDGEKHFELIESGPNASVLRCVVTARLRTVQHADIKDEKQWKQGWL